MKKKDLVIRLDSQATGIFAVSAVGLTSSAVLVYLTSAISSMNSVVSVIFQAVSVAFMIFAYVMTVKGFTVVNKACKLSETNEYYYFGRNMTVFSILSIVLSVIFEVAAFVLYMMLSMYSDAQALTPEDMTAAGNLRTITAIVVIAAQLVSISMPYIFYMWHIHKLVDKSDRIGTFALFTMFVMLVQTGIVILNSVYSVRGGDTSFLSSFAEILKVIEYLNLAIFFAVRKKKLQPVNELRIEE